MKNNNMTKKIVVYIFITLLLFSCLNYIFSTLDNSKTVTITMKQSSENDVTVSYKEDKYDGKNLKEKQTLAVNDSYETIKFKIPESYVYSLDLKLNTKENKTNKVDIQKLTVSTLFTKHEIIEFNNTSFEITDSSGLVKNIATHPIFSNFELTTKLKIISLLISLCIVFLLRNAINNLLDKQSESTDNAKVLMFTSFLLLVFFTNMVSLETEFSRLKFGYPKERPTLTDYDYVVDTSYMQQLEDYTKDHFFFSDFFTEDYFAFNELLQKNYFNSTFITKLNDKDLIITPYEANDKKTSNAKLGNIKKLSNLLEENDISHFYFFAPSKDYTLSLAYDNILPNYVTNDSKEIHKTFTEGLTEDNDYMKFYDLIDYMDKDAINSGTTHFYTDHHWTTETAFKSYQVVLKTLSENGLKPASTTEFKSETFKDKFAGADARKIASGNRYNQTKDDFTLMYPEDLGDYTATSLTDGKTKSGDFLEMLNTSFPYSSEDYIDMYSTYSFPFSNSKMTNNSLDDDTTILILGDSYARTLAWFLSTNYKNVIFLDQRDLDKGFTEQYIKENSDTIDAVINFNYLYSTVNNDTLFNYFK